MSTPSAKLFVEDALKELGAENIEWMSGNRTIVILEDGLALTLALLDQDQKIHIKCQLRGGGSKHLAPAAMVRLLQANFMWRGTSGAELVIENDRAVLIEEINTASTSYPEFRSRLEGILNAADSWSTALVDRKLEEAGKIA